VKSRGVGMDVDMDMGTGMGYGCCWRVLFGCGSQVVFSHVFFSGSAYQAKGLRWGVVGWRGINAQSFGERRSYLS
jgi:hypothetical protein